MNTLLRLLREPLFHFFAIGGLVFLLYTKVSGPAPAPVDSIVIGPGHVEQLAAGFERTWRRPPTDAELRGMVDDLVREEVYYREALALGLDRDDTVIRRRLRQKMEFLADTGADLLEPAAGELEAYLAANEETFRLAPRLAFEQIFLGEEPLQERIEASLAALRADPSQDPAGWGEPTLLPARLGLSSPTAVDGVFGDGFFDRLGQLPSGVWAGPVDSAYGAHLVRITDSRAGRMPPLEEVRDAALRDWRVAKAGELREALYARLRKRYSVTLPDGLAPGQEGR